MRDLSLALPEDKLIPEPTLAQRLDRVRAIAKAIRDRDNKCALVRNEWDQWGDWNDFSDFTDWMKW